MNFWQQKILPSSWHLCNKISYWQGSDTEERFLKNPISKWQGVDILYRHNSNGFRTHELSEFLDKEVNIALGCSFTEGIGIPIEYSWPSLLEQKLKFPMLNLGLGSGSTDTVARILTNISELFKIQKVFILWPELSRFELYHHNSIMPIGSWSAKEYHIWNMDHQNSIQRQQRNQNIVNLLSLHYQFEIIELSLEKMLITIPRDDPARDGMHYGITPNIKLAELFFNLIKS